MYSDEFQLGSAQLELVVYIQDDKQKTKVKKLLEHLHNESMECLHKWSLVLHSLDQGNDKELLYL